MLPAAALPALPLALSLFGARLPLLAGLVAAVALIAGLAVAEIRRETRREARRPRP